MPGADGLEVLTKAKELCPQTLVVLATAHGTLDTAIEAMRRGAFDYLSKPVSPNQIEILLKKASEYRSLVEENKFYRKAAVRPDDGFEDLVGRSDNMKDVFKLVDKVAGTSATVLINGESGTGKELIARAIHQRSPRVSKPFIRVNCAALPESLLESELFGHERGAFTGALERRPGRFELAHTGTLLLDEISETSLALQSKLLRVLQEREFERVGGNKTIKVDVRVICTSNRDLKKMVREGKFREDLFHRLNVVPISLPALRERNGDLLLLTEYFVKRHAERHHVAAPVLSPEARDLLVKHDWPGNVRELENTIERAVLLNEGPALTGVALGLHSNVTRVNGSSAIIKDLPSTNTIPDGIPADFDSEKAAIAHISTQPAEFDANSVNALSEVERRVILRVMKQANGNRTRAANILGISVRTLYSKLREYEVSTNLQTEPESISA
jgi:DNA-binding NtrC family response regulator